MNSGGAKYTIEAGQGGINSPNLKTSCWDKVAIRTLFSPDRPVRTPEVAIEVDC